MSAYTPENINVCVCIQVIKCIEVCTLKPVIFHLTFLCLPKSSLAIRAGVGIPLALPNNVPSQCHSVGKLTQALGTIYYSKNLGAEHTHRKIERKREIER